MADKFDLVADYREDNGKGASRRLRREGKVPAIIYGAGRPPRQLSFDHNKVLQQLQHESFYSSILNVKVGDKSQAAVVKDIQRHPAKPIVLHIDLQRIVEDEEIKMNIPIHYVGEKVAPGVKAGGSVSHLITDVEVQCLPKHLPEYFEVDISWMELDEMLHLSDLTIPEGVEIPELAQGPEHDQAIVSISVIKVVEIEEDVEDEAVEGEAADGEEGAQDDAAADSDDDSSND